MKKIITVVITLIVLCISVSAYATPVKVILDNSSLLVGPANNDELEFLSTDPYMPGHCKTIGSLNMSGKVHRSNIMVRATTDAFSTVDLYLKEYDSNLLSELGVRPNVEEIVYATLVEENYCIGHRFTSDKTASLVAVLNTQEDHLIHVLSTDWDNDGDLELCFAEFTYGNIKSGHRSSGNSHSSNHNHRDTRPFFIPIATR